MSRSLNPRSLCNIYTLAEIQEQVDFYKDQLKQSTVRMYDKDSSQGRQKVEAQDLKEIESVLAAWVRAYECKKGLGKPHIINTNFRGGPLSRIRNY